MSKDRDEEKRKIDDAMQAMPQWKRDFLAQEFGPLPGVVAKAQRRAESSSPRDERINLWTRFLRATIIVIFGAAIAVMALIFAVEIVVTAPLIVPKIVFPIAWAVAGYYFGRTR